MPRIKSGGGGLGGALKKAKNKPRTRKQIADRHTVESGGDRNLVSIVERNDLDEFVSTALLEQRSFEAERGDVVVVPSTSVDPSSVAHREVYDYGNIRIPRRPAWDKTTTPEQLDEAERLSFLDWRRELAKMSEASGMVVTPYEKNLDVWRQLWRVMERSDLVVQIVDARNPLLFYSKDLAAAVRELDTAKSTLVVVNKADYLSLDMRRCWAEYFRSQNLQFVFFSAKQEQSRQEQEAASQDLINGNTSKKNLEFKNAQDEEISVSCEDDSVNSAAQTSPDASDTDADLLPSSKSELDLLITTELIDRLLRCFWGDECSESKLRRITIGLVGYPNVGKSSIINTLLGTKKVGVAAMPGKTRHFQTLILNDRVTLCDCPGLVFPVLLSAKSELAVNGILPIDRLRDWRPAVALVCARVLVDQFHTLYGLRLGADVADHISGSTLVQELGRLRGLLTGRGLPDEARCARIILKDFTAGKLLYCHPPPGLLDDARDAFLRSLVPPAPPAHRANISSTRLQPIIQPKPAPDAMLEAATGRATGGTMAPSGSSIATRKMIKAERARAKAMMRRNNGSQATSGRGRKPRRNVVAVSDY